jgi:alpha-1,6-mannosyltransferase
MRLLDLTTLYLDGGEGGVNTYLREKARYVATRRPDVEHTIIVSGKTTRTESIDGSTIHFVRSPSLPGNPTHRVLVSFRKIRSLLRDVDPQVVEADCSYFLPRIARSTLSRDRVSIVGTIHAHLPQLYMRRVRNPLRSWFTSRTEFLSWRYAEFCARPCDRIVATSQGVLQSITESRRGHRFPPIEHIPLGVNLDLLRPGDRDAARIDGIDPTRPVVLYVGRLSPEKDLEVLLRAHESMNARVGCQLLIAGEGPLEKKIERYCSRESSARFLGAVPYGPELARLYHASDVLALPSRNEAFGLVVLEALACGLPVVAVNSGGPTETVRENVGYLAAPGDDAAFAAAIETAIESSRGASGASEAQRRRRYVETSFSWDVTFDRMFALYGQLVDPLRTAERVG